MDRSKGMAAEDLARSLDVHVDRVRAALDGLVRKGLVEEVGNAAGQPADVRPKE